MNSQRVSDDVHRLQHACEILLTEAGERIARSDDRQLGALVQLARQRTRALFELSSRLAARIDERRDLLLQAVRLSRLVTSIRGAVHRRLLASCRYRSSRMRWERSSVSSVWTRSSRPAPVASRGRWSSGCRACSSMQRRRRCPRCARDACWSRASEAGRAPTACVNAYASANLS